MTNKITVPEKHYDFDRNVYDRYYDHLNVIYNGRGTSEFLDDAREYALKCGVPEQYVDKVMSMAWSKGHAYGHHSVFNELEILIYIFN